jgi:predicted dehydrogenase
VTASSPLARTLAVGLIGCGRVAQRVHAPLLARMPGVRLAAVADPSSDAKSVARRCNPDVDLYDEPGHLLARGDIDAVVICLPTNMHADAAEDAFAAGKHVYLEKPIAATAADAARVLAAWAAARTVGMTGFNYRFHPMHQRLARLLAGGAIGRVTAIRTVFATPARDLPGWKRATATGGGVLLDLLSHHADLAEFHTGRRIASVSATTASIASEADHAAVTLTLNDGTPVQTTVSMASAEQDRFEIMGELGSLALDRFTNTLTHTPQKHAATTPEMTVRAVRRAAQAFGSLRPAMDPSFAVALRVFIDAVRSGSHVQPDLEAGWRSLAAVLAADASAAAGSAVTPVDLAPPTPPTPAPRNDLSVAPAAPAREPGSPALSVVLVSVDRFAPLRAVMRRLQAQSVASDIEVLLVAPTREALADMTDADAAGLHAVTPVPVGTIADIDKAAAAAVPRARAHFVAFIEDHAFPEPRWAERVLAAHRTGTWAAVGTAIENANPASALSWANMLMSYGQWVAAEHAGATLSVSRHNATFRTDVLRREYADRLPEMMGRDGGLLPDLIRRGGMFYLQPETHVRHVNPSTWKSTLELRIGSGRLFASSRMRRERWPLAKRLLYIAGAPAIPVIRYRLLGRELLGPDSRLRRERVGPLAVPALLVGVTLDGIGQLLGHALGPGTTAQKLAFFEIGRARHLRRSDLPVMEGAAP